MAGMDDVDFEGLVEGALASDDDDDTERVTVVDDDETTRFDARQLLRPKERKHLKTPVLSGRKMASESSAALPLVGEATAEMNVDPAVADAEDADRNAPLTTYERIYQKAGLLSHDFDIFKLEELYNDDEIIALEPAARKAAVRAILKSHDVDLQAIIENAVQRTDALEAHDQRMRKSVKRVADKMEAANTELQKEIEEFANPRLQQMETNEEHAEKARRKYRNWVHGKQGEVARIAGIVEEWGGDDRLRVTERVAAVEDNANTLRSNAVTGEATVEDVKVPRSEQFDAGMIPEGLGAELSAEGSEAEAKRRRESAPLVDLNEVSSPAPTPLGEEWSFSDVEEISPIDDEVSHAELEVAEREDPEVTESFTFQQGAMFVPRTAMQGVVAALAVVVWVAAGFLLTAQFTSLLISPWVMIVGWGAPVLFALLVCAVYEIRHRQVRFFSVLLLGSVIGFGVAHYDLANLHSRMTERPIFFIEEAGLNDQVEAQFAQIYAPYARFLEAQFGFEAPTEEPPSE